MGWDPKSNQLIPLDEEYLAAHPEAQHFQQFKEGETVLVRREADQARPFRAKFRIAELSANRMVLIAVGAEKAAQKALADEVKAKLDQLEQRAK